MNKNIIIISTLIITVFSLGCINPTETSNQDTIIIPNENLTVKHVEYGNGYSFDTVYPVVNATKFNIVFPDDRGNYIYHSTFIKFKYGNDTCYMKDGQASYSASCFKDN